MELNPLTIYLFQIVGDLKIAFAIMTFFGVASCFVYSTFYFVGLGFSNFSTKEKEIKFKSFCHWLLIFSSATLISGLIYIAIPSQKTMVAMAVVPKVIKNEQVQQLPENVIKFINSWLKENTKEKNK